MRRLIKAIFRLIGRLIVFVIVVILLSGWWYQVSPSSFMVVATGIRDYLEQHQVASQSPGALSSEVLPQTTVSPSEPRQFTSASSCVRYDVDDIINCANFTSAATEKLSGMTVELVGETELSSHCNAGESWDVVSSSTSYGCWIRDADGHEAIYLLSSGWFGVYSSTSISRPEVVLRHEFLHSVYNQLDTVTRSEIAQVEQAEFPSLYRYIRSLGYDPSEYDNELFVRIGSQYSSGTSSKAAAIYAQYLSDWSS